MVVAFINPLTVDQVVEPPKNAHITVKKKFKLLDIDESELINMLQSEIGTQKGIELNLGDIKDYDSDNNRVIEVLNPSPWISLHNKIMECLVLHSESRDSHFEGINYYPHVTWKLKGIKMLDPKPLVNTSHKINKLYLIQRIHPKISRAKIITRFYLI